MRVTALRRRLLLPLAAGVLALGCGDEPATPAAAPAPAEPPAAAAAPEPDAASGAVEVTPQPQGTVIARTVTRDGEVFEAEYGRENQLPSGFPDDVPLYGGARPLASMAAPEQGTIVNLRSADPPEQVYEWYRAHYAEQGWEIEKELAERGRHTVVARKGNRVSSVVIQALPGATQALLTVAEDR